MCMQHALIHSIPLTHAQHHHPGGPRLGAVEARARHDLTIHRLKRMHQRLRQAGLLGRQRCRRALAWGGRSRSVGGSGGQGLRSGIRRLCKIQPWFGQSVVPEPHRALEPTSLFPPLPPPPAPLPPPYPCRCAAPAQPPARGAAARRRAPRRQPRCAHQRPRRRRAARRRPRPPAVAPWPTVAGRQPPRCADPPCMVACPWPGQCPTESHPARGRRGRRGTRAACSCRHRRRRRRSPTGGGCVGLQCGGGGHR